jgi:hypothetical protein
MTNTNCLADIKCPKCGNDGSFRIEAVIVCHVTDDGSEPTGDHHWDKDSFCHCPECDFDGKVSDFYISMDTRPATEVSEATAAISRKPFDNYEISPCTRTEEPDSPGKFYFEVCEPEQADVWTLYGHIDGEGVEAIGDFRTREHAEETFQRITGIPFGESREIESHLRVMHAGQKLLAALDEVIDEDEGAVIGDGFDNPAIEKARSAIAEATGRPA